MQEEVLRNTAINALTSGREEMPEESAIREKMEQIREHHATAAQTAFFYKKMELVLQGLGK